jgi:hypothetical protein
MLDGEKLVLIPPSGGPLKPKGAIRIAHPLDLLHSDTLAAWQKNLFEKRVVQPFRQVFRELYVMTPAEKESKDHSMRFAGRSISDGKAARLFAARDWQIGGVDGPIIHKGWANQDIRGFFEVTDAGHYLGEMGKVTSGKVSFQEFGKDIERSGHAVALESVNPRVFSETMRDVDLVVSVAASDAGDWLSLPALTTRKDLLDAILSDLKIPAVTVEEKHALITGKLAKYRLHLGSGHIYLDPGSYLCVVPANAVKRDKRLFLPFVDDADPKLAEIFSKILMLVNDDKIRDKTILEQIEGNGQS